MIRFSFDDFIEKDRHESIKEHFDENDLKEIIDCQCQTEIDVLVFPDEPVKDPFTMIWKAQVDFKCCGRKMSITNRKMEDVLRQKQQRRDGLGQHDI